MDIDIKVIRLNKYTLEVHKKIHKYIKYIKIHKNT